MTNDPKIDKHYLVIAREDTKKKIFYFIREITL
jgi:hypothetical protein